MKHLILLSLAATALVPVSALAQDTAAPPTKWEDVPDAAIKPPPGAKPKPPAAATPVQPRPVAPPPTVQAAPVARPAAPPPPARVQAAPAPAPAPRAAPPARVQAAPAPAPAPRATPPARVQAAPPVTRMAPPPPARAEVRPAPPPPVVQAPPARAYARPLPPPPIVAPPPPPSADMRMRHGNAVAMDGRHHRGQSYSEYRRIGRGHHVPNHFWGPSYQIHNWGGYGLHQPGSGQRWIRYYDDALLIDDSGRVYDERYGYDWNRYGSDWAYDDRNVPYYVGTGDHDEWPQDYAYDEVADDHADYGEAHGGYVEEHHGGYQQGGSYSHPGYAQPGYGYYWASPGMVTETITTTVTEGGCASGCEEEVVVHEAPPPRRHKLRYPPRPGERG